MIKCESCVFSFPNNHQKSISEDNWRIQRCVACKSFGYYPERISHGKYERMKDLT